MTMQWSQCRTQGNAHVTTGVSRQWNPAAINVMEYTCRKIATGSRYGAYLMTRLRTGHVSDLQTYACRDIRGSSAHSEHSHAVAMDIRPFANPMSDRGILVTDFGMFGQDDGEKFLRSIGTPYPGVGPLWQWGGGLYSNNVNTWIACFRRRGHRITSGRVDAMHFEIDDGVTPSEAARVH